ncbi:MAG: HAMP domain-containing protein [bacterium]|nr:HAMP domain-containing protein [bacterium]
MDRMRAGLMTAAALLCLAGQGFLLHGAGRGSDATLPLPLLFLLLTCALAVLTALGDFRSGRRRIWRVAVLAALSVSLGLGLANLRQTGDEAEVLPGRAASRLADANASLTALGPALSAYRDVISADPATPFPAVTAADSAFVRGGSHFRALAGRLEAWTGLHPEAATLPVRLVVWSQGRRTAWTEGAEPLPIPLRTGRTLVPYRDGMVLRDVCTREDGAILSCQVVLSRKILAERWPGLRLIEATGASDVRPELARRIALGPREGAPFLVVGVDPAAERREWRAVRARIYVGLVVAWLVALTGTLGLRAGALGALAGLWLGRALAAAIDLHRWLDGMAPTHGSVADPESAAAPGSLASLVDIAYFATPFGAGWFASAADAVATGLLVLLTVWIVRRTVVDTRAPEDRPDLLPRRAGPRGAVFGLAAACVFGVVNLVAGTVAENANARLIGHGVTVEIVTFWALHLALALLAFAPVVLLTVLPSGVAKDGGRPIRSHLSDGITVAVVTLLATAALGLAWGLAAAAGLLAALVWFVIPLLDQSSGLPRRMVWPALLLLASVWNYGSLRAVYDRGELGWLESKGELVAASDPDWSRFVLGEVLVAMQEEGSSSVGAASGLWRHAAAWRLWNESTLAHLSLPCLVEIMDADYRSESLHAVGFMGDFQYELATRSSWSTPGKDGLLAGDDIVFQTERRLYIGGEEEVLVGEIARPGGGSIRAEIPLRSWRISTLLDQLTGRQRAGNDGYRPRIEIDREVLLLHADNTGWLAAGAAAFPGPEADVPTAALRSGLRDRVDVPVDGARWRCVWIPLPPGAVRTPGEGFLLGLRRSGVGENLLDLSRLLMLNLGFWLVAMAAVQVVRWVRLRFAGSGATEPWRPGFQERFLGGYLFIGLLLLLLVGGSVDRESRERIRAEARTQTRAGLEQVVDQLRSLLVEQARGLAGSEYIADLLEGQFAGRRTVGPMHLQQAMVFAADGTLLLDETLSDLNQEAAAHLLAAARRSPLVLMEDAEALYLGTVIPVDLGEVLATEVADDPRATTGFFFYRQRLDAGIMASLATLVRGELDLRVEGRMALTSAPDAVFSGLAPRLAEPTMMTSLLDHPAGATVLVDPHRSFAFTGYQPVPVFGTEAAGRLERRSLPGILAVAFPDRERLHNDQRRQTVLFLAGLANLILLTAMLLAVLLSWNVFRPLHVLLAATRSLGRGDYDAPLPEAGHDEVGRLAGAFGHMRDELATAQERVAARERFLTTVLDRVTVGVLVVDAADGLVALNPCGRDILRVFLPDAQEDAASMTLLDSFRDLAERSGSRGGELTGGDGRHTLRGALAPLDLPDGRSHTMLVFEDVTEFLENQKLALNAELARQVAHEIKNPLTPIQLSAQLVRQAWQDRHPNLEVIIDDAVVRILDQVELLRRIAGEFSLLGRPDGFITGPVDLEELVAETVSAYAGSAGHGADGPRFHVAPGPLPLVRGDADSLRKVLGNLAQNSLDAVAGDGPAVLHVDWRVEPESVTLIWRDEGGGIPADVAGRLFDPYFSTKSKGTGLGLAICRNLVDRMGGRIGLGNRTDGPGAVATLTLHRADSDEDPEETA